MWVLKVLSSIFEYFEKRYRNVMYYYLRIENAEGYVLIAVYLFIHLYACYSHNTKSIKPNRMQFDGMIDYYPGTI